MNTIETLNAVKALAKFYSAIYNRETKKPEWFRSGCGLCYNLFCYHRFHNLEIRLSDLEKIQNEFISNFLHCEEIEEFNPLYPFGGMEQYNDEQKNGKLWENPLRKKFIYTLNNLKS